MTDAIPSRDAALLYVENRLGFDDQVLRPFPKWFLIETINACNARCIMCGIDFDKNPNPRRMSDALFEKIAREIGQYHDHVEKVMLYLDGEPLLDKRLPRFIRTMKKNKVKIVNVASNASLLNEKLAQELMEAGLDEIYITVDSLKKEVYQAIRVGLDLDTVLDNIHRLIELRNHLKPSLVIRMQMVLQEKNLTEGDHFTHYWRTRLTAADQVVVRRAHNWGSQVAVHRFGGEDQANQIPCIALWGTFVVHADGTVPLCCMDTRSHYPLGHLNHESIAQIWGNAILAGYREKHLQRQRPDIRICDGCTLWRDDQHEIG
ncbi:MAG: radical SAM protein [Nitrospirae bacterium]|nr:radical SAM protein [Magnetococcales bacterium]